MLTVLLTDARVLAEQLERLEKVHASHSHEVECNKQQFHELLTARLAKHEQMQLGQADRSQRS